MNHGSMVTDRIVVNATAVSHKGTTVINQATVN